MIKFYKVLVIIISLCSICITANAQSELKVKVNNPPIPYMENVRWGNDLLVSNTEPDGKPSGVVKNSNSVIYVSVPDTNIQSGSGLVILSSSDNGASWQNISSVTPAAVISKTKMIRSSLDSIYCFFLRGSSIYKLNVLNNNLNQVFNGGYRDFDVAASSSGALYIFTDSLAFTSITRYGSINGGVSWISRGLISNAGAIPRIYMSGLGDTLVLNYYGPVLADTPTSVIRSVRYRETTPGTLATAGSFSNVVISSEEKTQFSSVYYGSNIWFFYTSTSGGNTDLKFKTSVNSGVSFTDSGTVGLKPGRDEFWFDAKHFTSGSGGVNIIYYSDSLQAGPPTNISDQMNFSSASASAPLTFSSPVQFSDHPPVYSANNYLPALIQYYNGSGDAGAIWVGDDGGSSRLYFDRLSALSAVTLNLTLNLEAISPVQDTVSVIVRKVFAPYQIVDSVKGYLNPSGTVSLNFPNALNNVSYYIVVRHRNSIETWSKSGGEIFTGGVLNYDLTTSASQAFGNNQILVDTKYSIYTGDVNQEGNVDLTDVILIFNDASLFVTGYVNTDLNYDDIVDLTDLVFGFNNSSNFVAVIKP